MARGPVQSYDRVLVVSEGTETEPNYFQGIKRHFRIRSLWIEASGGTSPLQVVEHAEKLFRSGSNRPRGFRAGEFDAIFAVFDRDSHADYQQALDKASSLDQHRTMENDQKTQVRFRAIPSNPCFELWLYLHFAYEPTHVPCEDILKKLLVHYPDYRKNAEDVFPRTMEHLDAACDNARRLAEIHSPYNDDELYTAVNHLVDELRNLGR